MEALDRPDLDKALVDANIDQLSQALIRAIYALPWTEAEKLRKDPGSDLAQNLSETLTALTGPIEHHRATGARHWLNRVKHTALVQIIIKYIGREHVHIPGWESVSDLSSPLHAEKPNRIDGFVPDVLCLRCTTYDHHHWRGEDAG